MSRKDRRGARKRSYRLPVAAVLVIILGLVAYFIFTSSSLGPGDNSPLIGKTVDATDAGYLNGVTEATLNTVGAGPAAILSPQTTASTAGVLPSPLTSNGKPEILYIGAEYCPYCGVERWAMIVALDKFGTFTGLEYMQSEATDPAGPNTSSFTFLHANYSSPYIVFVPVEQYDRAGALLQTPTSNESSLMTQYDSKSQSIPFIDIANQYIQVGSQYTPNQLRVGQSLTGAPYNWSVIASSLNTPSSNFAQNIDGAANRLISAICKVDNSQPATVCNQSSASTLSFMFPVGANSQPVVSDVAVAPSTMAPARITSRS